MTGTYPTVATEARLGFWHKDVQPGYKVVFNTNASGNWMGVGPTTGSQTTETAVEIAQGDLNSQGFHVMKVGLPTDTTPLALTFDSNDEAHLEFDIAVNIKDSGDNLVTFDNYNDYSTGAKGFENGSVSGTSATIGAKAVITKYDPSVVLNDGNGNISINMTEGGDQPFTGTGAISALVKHLSRSSNTYSVT